MFARLGPWCHDRRRLVLGIWIAVLVLGSVASGAVGGAFRDEFNLPDVESRQGFDLLDERVRGPGHRRRRHHRLPGRAGCRRPTGAARDGGRVRRGGRHRRRGPRREPLRRGGRAPGLVAGPGGGQGRLRQRGDARRHRLRSGRRDPRPDPGRRPRHRRRAGRAGRLHLRRVRGTLLGGAGSGLRHRDPHPGLRLGAGHGPARRRGPVRHRHRHRGHHPAQQRDGRARLRHLPRAS